MYDDVLIELKQLTKVYPPAFRALDAFDLTVRSGEIHALLGVNGAGKSTLIKILSGDVHKTDGTILVGGVDVGDVKNAKMASELGIGVVHQDLPLLPNLTAAENTALGLTDQSLLGGIDRRGVRERYRELAALLPGAPPADARVDSLSLYHWQLVAILRAMGGGSRVLVLDEPTSSLNTDERRSLHRLLKSLVKTGIGIIYVTHFLDDALDVADDVSVLRDGRLVHRGPADELTSESLLRHMTGDSAAQHASASAVTARATRDVQGTEAGGVVATDVESSGVGPLSFRAAPGECVGFYGLEGSGASELFEALFGLAPMTGQFTINGASVRGGTRRRIERGIGLVTSDRKAVVLGDWSVADNYTLPRLGSRPLFAPARSGRLRDRAAAGVESLSVKATLDQSMKELSGGNQQKLLLARWMDVAHSCLILNEPTHGVDARGRAGIHRALDELTGDRVALVYSSDPEEMVRIADRVLVMAGGLVIDELRGGEITVERLEQATRIRSRKAIAEQVTQREDEVV